MIAYEHKGLKLIRLSLERLKRNANAHSLLRNKLITILLRSRFRFAGLAFALWHRTILQQAGLHVWQPFQIKLDQLL